MKHLLRSLLVLLCIFCTSFSFSQPLQLTSLGASSPSSQAKFLQVGDRLFFTKNQDSSVDTLWQTDGTLQNTSIKAIFEGSIRTLARVNDVLIVNSQSADLTTSSTWGLGPDSNTPTLLREAVSSTFVPTYQEDGILLYDQRSGNQRSIWRTDGTPTGTYAIFNIYHTGASQWEVLATDESLFLIDRIIKKLYVVSLGEQEVLQEVVLDSYFHSMTYQLGYVWVRSGDTLWRFNTDGTDPSEFWEPGAYGFDLAEGVERDGILYFNGSDEEAGQELWRTDGSIHGTFRLQDIRPGNYPNGGSAYSSVPRHFFKYQNQVYFFATPERHDRLALYQISPGSEQAVLIKDIREETSILSLVEIQSWGEVMLIDAHSADYGREFWIFDGSDFSVLDIRPGSPGFSHSWNLISSIKTEDYLFLKADDGQHGEELWRLSPSGTESIMTDIHGGARWSSPSPIGFINNRVIVTVKGNGQEALLYSVAAEEEETAPLPEQPVKWFKTLIDLNLTYYEPSLMENMDMAITPDDDLLITGYFHSYIGLGASDEAHSWSLHTESTRQFHSTYLTRLSSDGQIKWTKTNLMYSIGSINAVTSNSQGDAITAGVFKDDLALSPQHLLQSTDRQFYLVSYDSDGAYKWHQTAEIGTEGRVSKCYTDAQDNIFVAGYYTGFEARFGAETLNSEISPAYFVVKYSPEGEILWAQTINMTEEWAAFGDLADLKIDENGNAYIVFGNAGYNLSASCEYRDFYMKVARLSPDGKLDWEKTFISSDLSFPTALAVANDNRLYLAGRFRGRILFDGYTERTDCQNSQGFLVQMDLQDGRVLQQPIIQENYAPYQLTADADGYLYSTGININGAYELSGNYQQFPFPYNGGEVVVKRYDPLLNLDDQRIFKKQIGNLAFENNPQISLDSNDEIILQDTKLGMIDTLAASSHVSQGQEVYLTKFSMKAKSLKPVDGAIQESDIILSPNPAGRILQLYSNDLDFSEARLKLVNSLGQEVSVETSRTSGNQRNLYLDHLASGRYFILVELNEKVYTKSFIKAE